MMEAPGPGGGHDVVVVVVVVIAIVVEARLVLRWKGSDEVGGPWRGQLRFEFEFWSW
jgi:hypothetical protein